MRDRSSSRENDDARTFAEGIGHRDGRVTVDDYFLCHAEAVELGLEIASLFFAPDPRKSSVENRRHRVEDGSRSKRLSHHVGDDLSRIFCAAGPHRGVSTFY